MITTAILIILLLLIIELMVTRNSNRISFWLGIISLLIWVTAVFKLFSAAKGLQ